VQYAIYCLLIRLTGTTAFSGSNN